MIKKTDKLDDYAKLPPQALEIEEAVLGALLIEKDAFLETIGIIKSQHFYKEEHQKIYQAIVELYQENKPVDILTVSNYLKTKGELEQIGGRYYISQLTSKVASASHISFHAKIVAQKFIQRELIRISTELQKRSYNEEDDVQDLINYAEKEIYDLTEGNIKQESKIIKELIDETIKEIKEISDKGIEFNGIASGFTELDRVTLGWQKSNLIILAARPSIGKTALALNFARNAAVIDEVAVALFSLEMSGRELVNRLIVSETEIYADKIKLGKLSSNEWQKIYKEIKDLEKSKFFIDDTAGISIFELRAKARRLKAKHNIQFIIIDYLQLMTINGEARVKNINREQEVSIISRSLKSLAKELDVPILALSQLSRNVEHRTDRRPRLSDLRESGSIEQDADVVMFIFRPEKNDENYPDNYAEIMVEKNRHGAQGDIRMKFVREFTKFVDEADIDVAGIGRQIITRQSKMNDEVEDEEPAF